MKPKYSIGDITKQKHYIKVIFYHPKDIWNNIILDNKNGYKVELYGETAEAVGRETFVYQTYIEYEEVFILDEVYMKLQQFNKEMEEIINEKN